MSVPGASVHIALADRDADDTYPAEHWCARKLDAWRALKRGYWNADNVGGQADLEYLSDETVTQMESNRDDMRAYGVREDAERTERAVRELKATDAKGWRAMECYHFVTTEQRRIGRVCKCRAETVPDLLTRGHESLYCFYVGQGRAY
ncbi:MAG: hypothetical protein ABI790_02410 [Betaproteobacteria bacterium]